MRRFGTRPDVSCAGKKCESKQLSTLAALLLLLFCQRAEARIGGQLLVKVCVLLQGMVFVLGQALRRRVGCRRSRDATFSVVVLLLHEALPDIESPLRHVLVRIRQLRIPPVLLGHLGDGQLVHSGRSCKEQGTLGPVARVQLLSVYQLDAQVEEQVGPSLVELFNAASDLLVALVEPVQACVRVERENAPMALPLDSLLQRRLRRRPAWQEELVHLRLQGEPPPQKELVPSIHEVLLDLLDDSHLVVDESREPPNDAVRMAIRGEELQLGFLVDEDPSALRGVSKLEALPRDFQLVDPRRGLLEHLASFSETG
eukprot:scaffold803_cov310-Pinguiococcus_pyrenoidosus.AAC.57